MDSSADLPFGMRVRRLREAKGWRRGDLAKKAGVSRSTITNVESGSNAPHLQTLRKLAKALEVSVEVLLDGHAEMSCKQLMAHQTLGRALRILGVNDDERSIALQAVLSARVPYTTVVDWLTFHDNQTNMRDATVLRRSGSDIRRGDQRRPKHRDG